MFTKSNNHFILSIFLWMVKSAYRKDREKSTDSCLQLKYRLSLEDYQEMSEAQHVDVPYVTLWVLIKGRIGYQSITGT
jgi:hypothetical protein